MTSILGCTTMASRSGFSGYLGASQEVLQVWLSREECLGLCSGAPYIDAKRTRCPSVAMVPRDSGAVDSSRGAGTEHRNGGKVRHSSRLRSGHFPSHWCIGSHLVAGAQAMMLLFRALSTSLVVMSSTTFVS
jgi:hypothetical protein